MTQSNDSASPTATMPLRPAVVDLAYDSDPVAGIHQSLSTCGFVAVRNTSINAELREQAFTSARAYFDQDTAEKQKDGYSDTQANFGYQGLQSEALDPAQAANEADMKEAFTMRSLSNRAQATEKAAKELTQSQWADSDFGRIAIDLHRACSDTATHLLSLIARALNAEADTFAKHHTGENMTLRYLHYPQIAPKQEVALKDGAKTSPVDKKMPQLGAGAHTDYGTITLLFSDGVAGLQLFDQSANHSAATRSGVWRDVVVAPGDVLVNTGDLMSLWSNGLYPSTLHRVLPRFETPDRYSIAFFVDPDSSTRVSPLPTCRGNRGKGSLEESRDAHPTTTNVVVAGEHIQARIEASQRTLA